MYGFKRSGLRVALLLGVVAVGLLAWERPDAPPPPGSDRPGPTSAFSVDGDVALQSFMTISDGHLKKIADELLLLATREDVRSGQWERIRGPLAEVATMSVPAVLWYAEPNGGYWTVQQGRAAGNLSDRPYFSRALAGATVIGDLVVSRSSNRNTAIVAVPVRRGGDGVVGALGASVHLDSLSALVRQQMGGLGDDLYFFSIDSKPMGAIHSDPGLIFTEPMRLGDEGMRRAFTEILSSREGRVTYDFRGRTRTIIYRKSPVTGWWYGLGLMRG